MCVRERERERKKYREGEYIEQKLLIHLNSNHLLAFTTFFMVSETTQFKFSFVVHSFHRFLRIRFISHILKHSCHMLLMNSFTTMYFIFKVVTLVNNQYSVTSIISSKTLVYKNYKRKHVLIHTLIV